VLCRFIIRSSFISLLNLHIVPRSENAWSYTFTPQYVFMAWCLVKHRDNFTFYLLPYFPYFLSFRTIGQLHNSIASKIRLNRDSSVGIALGYGLDDRGSGVRFPAWAGNFSLHHRVQNGSGSHPASYPMGTRTSFPQFKAAGE
jgi:hypothetical protein